MDQHNTGEGSTAGGQPEIKLGPSSASGFHDSRIKRPLERIDNTVDGSQNSLLKFTLARIDEDEDHEITIDSKSNNSIAPQTLPDDRTVHLTSSNGHGSNSINNSTRQSQTQSQTQSESESRSSKRSRSSGIPIPSTNPNINLKHINDLIGMNQTLNSRKPQQSTHTIPDHMMGKMVKLHDETLHRDIELTMKRNDVLNEELRGLTEKIDDLEIDINELKRANKKLVTRLLELRQAINSHKRKFEYLEDSIMKNVYNKEKMVNVKLKEYSNELDSQFEDFKFELSNQLAIAKNFKDDDIIQMIDKLNTKKSQLTSQFNHLLQMKTDKIKLETTELDKQLAKFLEQKMDKSDQLSKQYEFKQNKLNELVSQLNDLKLEIDLMKHENKFIQDQINTLESSDNNFINVKNDLLTKINALESKLSDITKIDNEFNVKLSKTNEIYEDISNRISKHNNTKLILENSILNHLNNSCRIYVNVPSYINPTLDNSFEINKNHFFQFDKTLSTNNQSDILAQFKYFISSNILNENLSIVLSGNELEPNNDQSPHQDLFAALVFNSYKQISNKWDYLTLNCKAIELTDNSINDILDSSQKLSNRLIESPKDITSQIMLLDEPENFKMILNNTMNQISPNSNYSCKFYNVNIKGEVSNHSVDSNISFLRVSNNSLTQQSDILSLKDTLANPMISSLLSYFHKLTKCFHLCQLSQMPNLEPALPLLNNLQELYHN